MKKVYFNVFDGQSINKISSDEIVDFLKNCNNTVTVSIVKNNTNSRIKLTPTKNDWIMKTNVNAKSCVVKQCRIVAIAKNHKRRIFSTIAECSKALNIDDSNISKVLKGKRNTAKGYKFEYL